MPQEHERGLGNWQAELAESAALLACVHGAVAALREAAEGLQVDAPRMARNIEALRGLVFAEALAMRSARIIGKAAAHEWVEALSRQAVAEGAHLRDVARAALPRHETLHAALAADELAALFDPALPAAHASALAHAQLAALAPQAAALRRAAPWKEQDGS